MSGRVRRITDALNRLDDRVLPAKWRNAPQLSPLELLISFSAAAVAIVFSERLGLWSWAVAFVVPQLLLWRRRRHGSGSTRP